MAKNNGGSNNGGNQNQGNQNPKPRIQENGAGATKGSRSEDRPVNPKK